LACVVVVAVLHQEYQIIFIISLFTMTVLGWIARVVVYGSLMAAIALNAAVVVSCNFLEVSNFPEGSLTIGLFTVSILGGECYEYDSENIDTPIKTARVSSILTIIFGPLVLFLMLFDEFCRVPFGDAFLRYYTI
jgi:hypothetical protein